MLYEVSLKVPTLHVTQWYGGNEYDASRNAIEQVRDGTATWNYEAVDVWPAEMSASPTTELSQLNFDVELVEEPDGALDESETALWTFSGFVDVTVEADSPEEAEKIAVALPAILSRPSFRP